MKDVFDVPIFYECFELYKAIHNSRNSLNKMDRFSIWQRCENTSLDLIENISLASASKDKNPYLIQASTNLNLLRVFIRLCKETKSIDNKKYLSLQTRIERIGKMLGGWLKSLQKQ